jgi:hypothetical protein
MPHPNSPASATGLLPVPVAVLLPPPRGLRHRRSAAGDLADWCGVAPRDVAGLITRYSNPGDLVIELNAHPTISHAAQHLGRSSTAVQPEGERPCLSASDPARQIQRIPHAGLIFAAFRRSGGHRLDLPATSAAIQTWRDRLRPGGHLLTALPPPGPELGLRERAVSYRATVIAAARTAGFTWQQEFLVLTVPLPEYEPRAMPDPPAHIPSALVDKRHQPAHIKVLAFRNEPGGSDA